MAASSIIGALRVNLGLDSAQFSTGLKRSKDQLGGFQKDILAIGAKIGGALAAAFSVRAMGQAADAWSDMSSRVGVAVGNMQAAPEVMARIHKIAQMTYSPLQQTADGFAENNAALKGLGYTTDQALDYTEALNNALVVSGAKGERAASVARALSVALATGKLSGDGLNSVLSNGGEIAELLAKELGTSRNGLIKMAQQGKITGDVIVKALIGNMDILREKAGDMPATIADGFQKIGNSFTGLIGRMDQAIGVSGGLAEILGKISEGMDAATNFLVANADLIITALNTLLGTGIAVAAYFAGQFAIGFVGGAASALKAAWTQAVALNLALGAGSVGAARMGAATKLLQGALIGLRGALMSTGIGAIVVGAGYLIGKFVEIVRATGGLGNAFKLMGEVIAGVWRGVWESAGAIPTALAGVWEAVKADFYLLMQTLSFAWASFLTRMGASFRSAGMDGFADKLKIAEDAADAGGNEWGEASIDAAAASRKHYAEAAKASSAGFIAAGEALAKLNVTVHETSESLEDNNKKLNDAGDKASGAGKKLSKFQEIIKSLREEAERLKATVNMTDLQAAIWGKQKEAGVSAGGAQGQQIEALMTQIDGMERLKEATEKGRDAMKDLFGSALEGAGAFKKALTNLIAEMAKVQFTKGMMGLLGTVPGGSGLLSGIGNLLSFDGGGYTWDGPRSGGLDGRGGRLALLHPQETVYDHTRSQAPGGSIGMQASELTLTDGGQIMARVRAEVQGGIAANNRAIADQRYLNGGR